MFFFYMQVSLNPGQSVRLFVRDRRWTEVADKTQQNLADMEVDQVADKASRRHCGGRHGGGQGGRHGGRQDGRHLGGHGGRH